MNEELVQCRQITRRTMMPPAPDNMTNSMLVVLAVLVECALGRNESVIGKKHSFLLRVSLGNCFST